MNRVQATPPLPYPDGKTLDELAQFDKDIRKALYQYLMSVATRLNGVLPKDGSEPATGRITAAGFTTTSNNALFHELDNQGIVLSGGNLGGSGANIELYGGTHATQANNAYYDAATHTFRVTNGSTLNVISACGMQFPATQIASGDANRLDDYEEGTWTPTINFSGGSTGITYTTQAGSYVKIGQLVFYQGRVILSNKGSSVGNARIGGFPFTAANTSHGYTPGSVSFAQNFTGLTGALSHYVEVNNTYSNIMQSAAGGAAFVADTAFTNTTDIIFAGTYRASA